MGLITTAARADLTIKQEGKTSGLMGLLNTETKATSYIKGDMKCDDTEVKLTNKLMKFAGGGKPIKTSSVVNLANGTMLNIDHMNKACNEMALSEVGEMANSFMGKGPSDKMAEGQKFDTSKVTMSPPEITVEETGNSEKIAGYNSDEYLIKMHMTGKDRESGEEFEFDIDLDLWIAKGVPGFDEFQAFNKRMVEEMGFDAAGAFGGSTSSMLSMYGVDSKELQARADDLDGIPMRTVMKLKGSGGQFDEMGAAGMPTGEGDGKEENPMAAKMLKGLFGGGGDDSGEDDGYIMTVRTEVKDISTKNVKDDKFSCPNKYKSKDNE